MTRSSVQEVFRSNPDFMRSAEYLGVDLSLRNTGVAIRTSTGLMMSFVISPPKGLVGSPRLDFLDGQFAALLDHPWKSVATEGYSLGNRFTRDHDLGECGGLFRLQAWRRGHHLLVVPPKTLKKYGTGSGNAKKPQMIAACLSRWGLTVTDDNEADAICLSDMAYRSVNRGEVLPKESMEALDKVSTIPARSQARERTRKAT